MKIKALIFFLTLCNLCLAQVPDLTNWIIDTLPTDDRIYPANNSNDNWIFSKSGDKWEIVRNSFKREKGDSFPFSPDFIDRNLKEIKGNRFVKKTSDGYFVLSSKLMKMEQTKQPKVAVKGLSKFNTGGSQPQADNHGRAKRDRQSWRIRIINHH